MRVNQAFLDAQVMINNLRSGKTFVDVVNYVDYFNYFPNFTTENMGDVPFETPYTIPGYYYAPPNNVSPIPGYEYDYVTRPSGFGLAYNRVPLLGGCYPWVVAPDPTEKFFGTDWFHIYCTGGRYLSELIETASGSGPTYIASAQQR